MNLYDAFKAGLPYAEFLARHGNAAHQSRWANTHREIRLDDRQLRLLGLFHRRMHVLCLAGAWCGDCARQGPILQRFAEAAPLIQLHFLDRDLHPQVQTALAINGGHRVPVVVFFSEDGYEVSRFGERTLSAYRRLIEEELTDTCPTGIGPHGGDALMPAVVQDWLNEFERVQWILRLSPRLRQRYGD